MTNLAQIDDFTGLLKSDTPLLDTRAPIEYKQGAFPSSYNIPLMDDNERKLVGTCYKKNGRSEAIMLGHELVNGEIKEARINYWIKFINAYPAGALYCFRGGMRSEIVQRWVFEHSGINYPRIKGGYKAIRRLLIDETTKIMSTTNAIVVGGQTGSGKTILLQKIKSKIDLEGLANHRGSAFGNTTTPQPTQIAFENNLGVELLKKQELKSLVFEDEGSNIGTIHIPPSVQEITSTADLVLLQASVDERIDVSMDAYVISMCADFIDQDSVKGFDNFSNYWLGSINKIQKRLGLSRYKEMINLVTGALNKYRMDDDTDGFLPVIEKLLVDYYDPMYAYQIKKKRERVVFTGNYYEVLDYLHQRSIS
jgi:tRNA 2-selenouridine synthase